MAITIIANSPLSQEEDLELAPPSEGQAPQTSIPAEEQKTEVPQQTPVEKPDFWSDAEKKKPSQINRGLENLVHEWKKLYADPNVPNKELELDSLFKRILVSPLEFQDGKQTTIEDFTKKMISIENNKVKKMPGYANPPGSLYNFVDMETAKSLVMEILMKYTPSSGEVTLEQTGEGFSHYFPTTLSYMLKPALINEYNAAKAVKMMSNEERLLTQNFSPEFIEKLEGMDEISRGLEILRQMDYAPNSDPKNFVDYKTHLNNAIAEWNKVFKVLSQKDPRLAALQLIPYTEQDWDRNQLYSTRTQKDEKNSHTFTEMNLFLKQFFAHNPTAVDWFAKKGYMTPKDMAQGGKAFLKLRMFQEKKRFITPESIHKQIQKLREGPTTSLEWQSGEGETFERTDIKDGGREIVDEAKEVTLKDPASILSKPIVDPTKTDPSVLEGILHGVGGTKGQTSDSLPKYEEMARASLAASGVENPDHNQLWRAMKQAIMSEYEKELTTESENHDLQPLDPNSDEFKQLYYQKQKALGPKLDEYIKTKAATMQTTNPAAPWAKNPKADPWVKNVQQRWNKVVPLLSNPMTKKEIFTHLVNSAFSENEPLQREIGLAIAGNFNLLQQKQDNKQNMQDLFNKIQKRLPRTNETPKGAFARLLNEVTGRMIGVLGDDKKYEEVLAALAQKGINVDPNARAAIAYGLRVVKFASALYK